MALTDTKIRAAKPRERPYKLADGHGLYLIVHPSGGRWWRLRYRHGGKERLLSLGVYPEVGLKEARRRRDEARKQLAAGIDPGAARKAAKAAEADTLEVVAREWYGGHAPQWVAGHSERVLRRLEKDVFPILGDRPVGKVTAPELLACIRRIEARGSIATARRALQTCEKILAFSIASGRAERNPASDIRDALQPAVKNHFAAITDPTAVGALLRAIDGYDGDLPTRCALKLAPLVFVRPGELRGAEWREFEDLEAGGEWNIAATRMKMRIAHTVPLSVQAIAILRELHPLTGGGRFVFPSARGADRAMSEGTLNAALRRLGYSKAEMCVHGFRAMARTILDEVLGFAPHLVEHQLAHTVRDPLGRSYNRTAHLPERRAMMERWAVYLDNLRNGADVVPIRARR